MDYPEPILLTRDVEVIQIPAGTKTILPAGTEVRITQVLGGSYTVAFYGGLVRIDGKDADAIGKEVVATPATTRSYGAPLKPQEQMEAEIWKSLRTIYDPEIPVNIADLGLIYECKLSPHAEPEGYRADVKMTLTAPGCGMGEVLKQDVENKLRCLEGIEDVGVELVWEPQWNQGLMTEAARLQLGLM